MESVCKILEKILLPPDSFWEIKDIVFEEASQCIYVDLRYTSDVVWQGEVCYPVFNYCRERVWRHWDLWKYRTYLRACLPLYKIGEGYKTADAPWQKTWV